jgi:hypothetical protein
MDSFIEEHYSSGWSIAFTLISVLVVSAEVGFQQGLRLYRLADKSDDQGRGLAGALQGSILGLLALLLGFSFAMAVDRYNKRLELVVKEANAIGTTYLRADFLPGDHGVAVKALLREYVDARLWFYTAGQDLNELTQAERLTFEIQRTLWDQTKSSGSISNSPLLASFVASLNETIDTDALRMAAFRNHVPDAVWFLLLIVAISGSGVTGYAAGTSGHRLFLSQILLPLLIAIVIIILFDLDSPRRGWVNISQQSLMDLKKSMSHSD